MYVFVKDVNGDWIEQERISASNDSSSYFDLLSFGSAVALYEDTLIVGAVSEDSISTGVNSVQAPEGDSGVPANAAIGVP